MYKIADSHSDFLTAIKSNYQIKKYINNLQNTPINTLCCAVFTTDDNLSLEQIKRYKRKISGKLNNIKLLFAIEDLGSIKDFDELSKLIQLKPISCSLTWNNNNKYSSGAFSKNGLTKLGKQAIKMMEANNVFVDTAHLNKKSFYQFCKMTTKPIYNSHSNIYSLHKHKRNLTDKQIKMIVRSGGYLGITIYRDFVSNKKAISSYDIALQFDYLIKNFGYKNFGFGTDFFGIDQNSMPVDIATYNDLNKVAFHLLKMGYDKEIVSCIMYKNYQNFLLNNKLV